MFMDKNDWSDDDLEDVDADTLVVPISMVPTPQVLSNGSQQVTSEPYRASAYNERMARARNAVQSQRRTSSSGMIMANAERDPASRPGTASARGAPSISVLTQEVEEMELAEQQIEAKIKQSQQQQQQQQSASSGLSAASYAKNPPAPFGQNSVNRAERTERTEREREAPGSRSPPERESAPRSQPAYSQPSQPADDEPIDIGDGDSPPPPQQPGRSTPNSSPSAGAVERVPRPLEVTPAVIDTSDLRAFLMRTGPQGAMVQCYIQRRKSGLARLYPTYEVYLKDGEQFLLAARRRKKQKQSNYKVSLDREDLSRHSSNYFGKLKSNFMGTEFQMYDSGVNPEKLSDAQKDGSMSQVRQELATILYKQNVLGSRGPRKMKVLVPNVDDMGNRATLRPTSMDDTMIERYKASKVEDNMQVLKNKQPKWNDQVGAYVLNFNGRVTRASVKNFQLCNVARDPDLVVMQFGRVGKDAFTMDYQWPLCGLQAFGIALSSFDYKIACE